MLNPVSPDDNVPHQDAELVPVRTVYGYWVAQVIKTKLESEGIPAVLRYESVGRVLGITVDGLGQVEVMVPRSLAEQAKHILAHAEPIHDLPAADAEKESPHSTTVK